MSQPTVAAFYVAVDDALFVQEAQAAKDLPRVGLHHLLGKSAKGLEHLRH